MKKNQLLPLPSSYSAVCGRTRCEEPSTVVVEFIGHPNGDITSAYCVEHASTNAGIWEDSPATYKICFTGPFLPRSK